jgi:hypothetical protein
MPTIQVILEKPVVHFRQGDKSLPGFLIVFFSGQIAHLTGLIAIMLGLGEIGINGP